MTVRASIQLDSGGIPQASRLVLSVFPKAQPVPRLAHAYDLPNGAGRALANFSGPMFILADGPAGEEALGNLQRYAGARGLDCRLA